MAPRMTAQRLQFTETYQERRENAGKPKKVSPRSHNGIPMNASQRIPIALLPGMDGTGELLDALASLRAGGFAVSLVLVQSDTLPALTRDRAALLGISIWPVWRERDLEHTPHLHRTAGAM